MSSYYTLLGSDQVFHHGGGFRSASGTFQLFGFMNSDLSAIRTTVCLTQTEFNELDSQGAIIPIQLDDIKPGQMEFRL